MEKTAGRLVKTDEYYLLLGRISVRLSQLDHLISFAIGYLTSKEYPGRVLHITNEINSIATRIKIFETMSEAVLSKDVHEQTLKFTGEISGINKRRNKYIHSLWVTVTEEPHHINWKKIGDELKFEPIDLNDLQALTKDANRIVREFYDFVDRNIRQPIGFEPASLRLFENESEE